MSSIAKTKQQPLHLASASKRDVRTQFGALCWRQHKDEVQVLLVTSRRTRRWILPKGWPVDGATPSQAAETEAWEEAGVKGKAMQTCLGIYSYSKFIHKMNQLPCVVAIFPVKVRKLSENWPEKGQRKRKWFSTAKAATIVDDKELAGVLRHFDPSRL